MTQTVSDNGVTYGSTAAAHSLFSIGASVAGNALTITLDPTTIAFRSTTLTSGTPVVVQNASQLSITVPSSATLGTVNATQSDIYVLAINNAGTMELAVVNVAGGTALDETGLITTTTISASATSASTIYSTTGRSSVAYKVVGMVRSTQATAGTWASAPSLVQGAGGNVLDSLGSLGYGQTWQDVKASRVSGTTYYNTTGKPITVVVTGGTDSNTINTTVGGVSVSGTSGTSGISRGGATFVVPSGSAYSVTYSGTFFIWVELR